MAGDAPLGPEAGAELCTELEEVEKGSRRCLGARRVSQVEGNPERRGCSAISTRNSEHFGKGVPAARTSLLSFTWMLIPARVEIQMRD